MDLEKERTYRGFLKLEVLLLQNLAAGQVLLHRSVDQLHSFGDFTISIRRRGSSAIFAFVRWAVVNGRNFVGDRCRRIGWFFGFILRGVSVSIGIRLFAPVVVSYRGKQK